MYKVRTSRTRKNTLLLFSLGKDYPFIVFDVETTGKKCEVDYIVQISAIKYIAIDSVPQEIDRLDVYIKPPFLMEQDVMNVHHITNEFLEDKPSEEEVFEYIKNFFGINPIVLGYNVEFDVGFMKKMYERMGEEFTPQIYLDILDMARDIIKDKMENYKLETVVKHYGLDDEITFHSAIDDVIATSRLLFLFKEEYKKIKDDGPKETIILNYCYFWSGKRKEQAGIYFDTNFGKILLSTFQKCWVSKKNLDLLDIDSFERAICARTGLNFNELAKMTEKKFKNLREQKKI